MFTRNIFVIVVIFVFFVVFLYSDLTPSLYFENLDNRTLDVSCHNNSIIGELPVLNSSAFFPLKHSIFFHHTECPSRLNSRQACTVEAAAVNHPKWDIYVLFSGPMDEKAATDVNIELLKLYGNIRFYRVFLEDYAKGTPVESFIKNGSLAKSRYPVIHTLDVFRFLTLYKWGGICLDFDDVLVQPFDEFPRNWACIEKKLMNVDAVSISKDETGRKVADTLLRKLVKSFTGNKLEETGPTLLTEVLKEVCKIKDVKYFDDCVGFEIFPQEFFNPIKAEDVKEFFTKGDFGTGDNYIFHLWNEITRDFKVEPNSSYAQMAETFCPLIYENYGERFGNV